ncbi:hypothetical protein CC80DRAFT_514371 [Byssothecium circinans]|uniref:Uncharacterized protein n=1 Tax=Byssothecium circinans TaxID=147558 RepID=A0A6A5U557_9PLEO|nr:hypothetical protein CC80DRAFT_514371 [Byssothecium circinans]
MATESDPAVTRVTVLFIRRDVTNRHGLWQHINPDYRTQTKAMADLNTDISKTIAARHIHLIEDHDTPYDQLVTLKKFFCPTDATRRRELADKYNALKTAPRAAKKVEQWLADWVYITAQGKLIKLPETKGNRLQEDFLIACKALDQEYATSCLREIFKHEARGTTTEISSLETYVAEMTTYLRRTKPHSTGLAVLAAELGVTKQDYRPTAEMARKVEEAQKDPKINARIKTALEKWTAQ